MHFDVVNTRVVVFVSLKDSIRARNTRHEYETTMFSIMESYIYVSLSTCSAFIWLIVRDSPGRGKILVSTRIRGRVASHGEKTVCISGLEYLHRCEPFLFYSAPKYTLAWFTILLSGVKSRRLPKLGVTSYRHREN